MHLLFPSFWYEILIPVTRTENLDRVPRAELLGPPDVTRSVDVSQVVGKRLAEQVCLEEATDSSDNRISFQLRSAEFRSDKHKLG